MDVLLWGGTHRFEAYEMEGRFFVNPGSATGALGTGWWAEDEECVPSFVLMDVSFWVGSLVVGGILIGAVCDRFKAKCSWCTSTSLGKMRTAWRMSEWRRCRTESRRQQLARHEVPVQLQYIRIYLHFYCTDKSLS